MGKTFVLDRVTSDLARGLTHPAIQRLSSLVAAHPTDLDLRRRLAAAYRRVGNRIQAGRWDYLTIGADTSDTSAFERAFPSAVARLRAIRWPHRAVSAPTSYARSRLAKLVAAAQAEDPHAAASLAEGVASLTTPPSTNGQSGTAAPIRASLASVRRLLWTAVPVPRRPLGSALLTVGAVAVAVLVAVGVATVIDWLVL